MRFDVSAETVLPVPPSRALADFIRRDLWRNLRLQRGFRPAVRLTRVAAGTRVEAGGAVLCPKSAALNDRVAALLENPARRNLWISGVTR